MSGLKCTQYVSSSLSQFSTSYVRNVHSFNNEWKSELNEPLFVIRPRQTFEIRAL